jgi:hypothetical protein
MSQPLQPGWPDKPAPEEPKPAFRFSEDARQTSRLRGGQRGMRSRYGLRNLPPIDEDNPEDFGV